METYLTLAGIIAFLYFSFKIARKAKNISNQNKDIYKTRYYSRKS